MFEKFDIKGPIHIVDNPKHAHQLSMQGWQLRAVYDCESIQEMADASVGLPNKSITAVYYAYLFEWPEDKGPAPYFYFEDEEQTLPTDKTQAEQDLETLAKELGTVKTKKLLGREIIPESKDNEQT